MTRDDFAAWLDRYVEAWRSNDAAAIGELFSEDATYSYRGGSDRIEGREAIVALARGPGPAGLLRGRATSRWPSTATSTSRGGLAVLRARRQHARRVQQHLRLRVRRGGRCRSFTEW